MAGPWLVVQRNLFCAMTSSSPSSPQAAEISIGGDGTQQALRVGGRARSIVVLAITFDVGVDEVWEPNRLRLASPHSYEARDRPTSQSVY
jgi:hypothetical protein